MTEFLQQIINGLSLGAIYALIALGYTMVYGVLRFINFAHSDVFMVGAFGGYYLGNLFHGDITEITSMPWPFAAGIGAIVGIMLSRGLAIRVKWQSVLLRTACAAVCALVVVTVNYYSPRFIDPILPSLVIKNIWLLGAVTLVCTMIFCAVLGILIEKAAYRPLRGGSNLNILITAIGVSLLLENGGQFLFGADTKAFPVLFPDSNFSLGADVVVSSTQVAIFVVTILLLLALRFIVLKTRIGTAMRALSFNRVAASLVGINNDVVISFTFGLGSALAAAGGIMYSMNYQSVDPLMGVLPGLKAFVAAVLGGIGNIPGAALGGLLLGLIETFAKSSPWSTYTDAIAFALLILILLFRPAGLLGKLQVEKV
jgi:branched-chain amino acid transport system permease protein